MMDESNRTELIPTDESYYDYFDNTTETFGSTYTQEDIDLYYYYINISIAIWKYVPGVLLVVGVIGNALSALVMTRPSLKKNVSSLFFTILAFVDTFCLLTGLLRYWILGLTEDDHDIRNDSEVSCILHTFLVYWSADFSGWILALVSAERCLAASFPHIYKQSCTRKKAAISLIICALLLVAVNCHLLFGLEMNTNNNKNVSSCHNKPIIDHYHGFVFPWIDLIFFCLGPFFCILICNISIIIKVLRSRAVTRAATSTDKSTRNRLSSMTAILICVSIFYIVCTAPVAVYLIYQNSWLHGSELVFYGKMQLYWAVASIMSYFNNSMNFFLYCISGPRFRKELIRMFGGLRSLSISHESSVSGI